jgi:capsular exopolysaccharide synthesis family protein
MEVRLLKKLPAPEIDQVDMVTEEFYRVLFSGMERRLNGRPVKSIAVTSSVKGEGKTTTVIHLARVAARDFGKKVLLLEGDLKNPQFSRYWTNPDGVGLYQVLTQQVEFDKAILDTGQERLDAMPVGRVDKNRSVSGSILFRGLRNVIQEATSRYDYVFVDSPPILPLVDMRIIANAVDGVIMVVCAEGSPRSVIIKSVESIPREKILGVVLNGVKVSWSGYTYGYTY